MWVAGIIDNWDSLTVDIYIYHLESDGTRNLVQMEDELNYTTENVPPGVRFPKPTFSLPTEIFESIKLAILTARDD
jgi:hypothetical protein